MCRSCWPGQQPASQPNLLFQAKTCECPRVKDWSCQSRTRSCVLLYILQQGFPSTAGLIKICNQRSSKLEILEARTQKLNAQTLTKTHTHTQRHTHKIDTCNQTCEPSFPLVFFIATPPLTCFPGQNIRFRHLQSNMITASKPYAHASCSEI